MHSALGTGHVVAGRYRLLDQLGRGAMGIVWRGRDELLDREVAIKQIVLPPMASGTQARASYERTLREARTAARLSHPGVVTVFDVAEEDGSPWIVMELVRARPLDQVIAEDGPLPPARAAQLGLGLLEALTAAHKAGVLHRDVKPSNVLISPDGKAVLTDFGIATIQGDPGLTQAGMVVGTPGFSPPERVRGGPATPASDLWSLGATLYAAVEGRGPFDRAGGSAAIVASIATEPAPRAPSAGPLATVIEALLKADPADRPDAAATAKMLTQAWKAARTAGRVGPPGAASAAGLARMAGLAKSGANPQGRPGSEATTATQFMGVPPDAGPIGGGLDRDLAAAVPGGAAGSSPGAAAASVAVVTPAAADAVSVVPDLMATPNFADLKMPDATTASGEGLTGGDPGLTDQIEAAAVATDQPPASPPGQPGGAPAADGEDGKDGKASDLLKSRRGLVALAPVVVLAIVAGIVYATLPSVRNPLERLIGGGSGQNPIAAHAGNGLKRGSHPGRQSSGKRTGPGNSAPSGTPAPGKPSASGKPGRSGKPTPSGKPSGRSSSGKPSASPTPSTTHGPSPSPDPSPTPTQTSPGSGGPPAGYVWDTVTAASVGTNAGFRIAGPAAWVMSPGLNTVIYPVAGAARLDVNLGQWPVSAPVKEARHLQAVDIAHHRYRQYELISIVATKFRGWPAARWTFWWQPASAVNPTEVTELLFTAQTYAGPQQYIMWISAPLPRVAWALKIFHVATRTFKVLPFS
jgi:eukaryotic-like serine/threonine-protein kinase